MSDFSEFTEESDPDAGEPYYVGVTILDRDPSKERYRNMLYLVAYDIRDPKRLRRVAKVCADYGVRVEYSVFECDLSEEQFGSLWIDLVKEIDRSEDSILAYRICGSCVDRIKSLGQVIRPGKTLVYII